MTNKNLQEKQVTISIVSHGHCNMLLNLLEQIDDLCSPICHVIITHNKPSELIIDQNHYSYQITVLQNELLLGFSANHNQAFEYCLTEYFCILNPDVEFFEDPFHELLKCLEEKNVGLVAPTVKDINGVIEDSFRKFPTPLSILKKAFYKEKGLYKEEKNSSFIYPDWVAGIFMLLRSSDYRNLCGFDDAYFLYYEDIDFCLRMWKRSNSVMMSKKVSIIHNAQRESHKNPKFFLFHIRSMCRFFMKHWLRFPR